MAVELWPTWWKRVPLSASCWGRSILLMHSTCMIRQYFWSKFHLLPNIRSKITDRNAPPVPYELPCSISTCRCRVKVKVKGSRYRPGVAQRVGTGIAVLFPDRGTRMGVSGQQHAPAALYPRERPCTHFTGGWVGPRACLDGRKISSPPGFDPGPSSP